MDKTGQSVAEHLAHVTPAVRRRDADTLVALMGEVSGREPQMWSAGIVGFGTCRYTYPTGTEGLSPILGFAARKTAAVLYVLDDVQAQENALSRLGPHTRGKGCLYLKDLDKNDPVALRELIQRAYDEVIAGGSAYAEFTVID
ncbi:DUF1801 domain-containing protein [Microbacterium sp. W1N]|uniref:DUF1801 domain-containing protein n=1 Tax=Microbacterium festucae TaxID=2977531 RepID=UPI0021BF1520|nr:DUF1801 domain-containing protein [Microbacterium festucae]MCT9819679.1 DUF1801 domain-containing protein [Microbacterium festucae]